MTMKMVESVIFGSGSEEVLEAASAAMTACELLASGRGESRSGAGPVSCWTKDVPVSPEAILGE